MRNIYKEACIKAIERKVNWGNSEEWKQRQFNNLSQKILDVTGVVISPQTLKRFFGKITTSEDYLPQEATLNAFAQYLGYNHWTNFEESIDKNPEEKEALTSQVKTKTENANGKAAYKKKVTLIGIIALLLAGVIVAVFLNLSAMPEAILTSATHEGQAPLTVVFNYDLPDYKDGQEYTITFSNTGEKPSILQPESKTITHYFPYPGYSIATIRYKEQVLAKHPVLVFNDKWLVEIGGFKSPKRFLKDVADSDTMLYISPENIRALDVDTKQYFQTQYKLAQNFGVKLDNCRIEFKLRNDRVTMDDFYCNFSKIRLMGSKNNFSAQFSDNKCFNKNYVHIGDNKISGRVHDLSKLSVDMDDWTDITIDIHHNEIQMYINNKLAFESAYNVKLGKFYSAAVLFNTTGAIKEFKIAEFQSKTIQFEQHFASDSTGNSASR